MPKKVSRSDSLNLPIGSKEYRAYIGPPKDYDINSALQFNLLTTLGLREHHRLLDIGCGSLLGGKLFIPYLLPGKYYGIEPERWLVKKGLENEVGHDLAAIKKPLFNYNSSFKLSAFNKYFDYLLAHSIFSHASQDQIIKCIGEAKKVMKKSSIFIASYVKGAKNYKGESWIYPECVTYKKEFLIKIARKSGLAYQEIDWPHPNLQTWFLLKYPENSAKFSDLNNSSKFLKVQNQLYYTQKNLKSIKSHPYVKVGFAINNIYQSVRRKHSNKRLK